MASDDPAIPLPPLELLIQDLNGDGASLVLMVKTIQGAVAAELSPLRTADLALAMLDWLSCSSGQATETLARRPLIPLGLHFQAGRSSTHIVLAVDFGAGTLRFEVPHNQLGAALAQLDLSEGEPPKAN